MRKEVILAVIIGVILGVVILYGINLANNSSKSATSDSDSTETNPKTTPTPANKLNNQISISIPQDNSVVTDSVISLKGTAKPNLNIAIISESDDILTTSDANGNFGASINLISGENIISITTIDDKQATSSSSITVIRTATMPE